MPVGSLISISCSKEEHTTSISHHLLRQICYVSIIILFITKFSFVFDDKKPTHVMNTVIPPHHSVRENMSNKHARKRHTQIQEDEEEGN